MAQSTTPSRSTTNKNVGETSTKSKSTKSTSLKPKESTHKASGTKTPTTSKAALELFPAKVVLSAMDKPKTTKDFDTSASLEDSTTSFQMPSSAIFEALTFILTHGEKTRVKDRQRVGRKEDDVSTSESEADENLTSEVKFVKTTLTRQIVTGGGVIFHQKNLAGFDTLDAKTTFCVANTFCRTAKFINALGKALIHMFLF